MHAYLGWRLTATPGLTGQYTRLLTLLLLLLTWSALPLTFAANSMGLSVLGTHFVTFAMTWLGCLFLLCAGLFLVDLITLGGLVLRPWTGALRLSGLLFGLGLCATAFIQGTRSPAVNEHEVILPGLPPAQDGLKLALLSDLHLGTSLTEAWLQELVLLVSDLKPDLIVVAGDLVDRDSSVVVPMVPTLAKLRAPLGVWAVQGNHDVYGGAEASLKIMRDAGFHVLRDHSELVTPGLRMAGVDDLGLRARGGDPEAAVARALAGVTQGTEACIFVSHTPDRYEEAARLGAGLMLSGHTHGGQLWPFNYLVKTRFKYIEGCQKVGDMSLVISRGAGTWGPRMRLWRRSEVVLITLRAPKPPTRTDLVVR